jgi:prephenate dehydrogenase
MLKVAVVGLGQIGASLGLALKNKVLKNHYFVVGIGRKKETLKSALKLKAVDEVSLSFDAVKFCDIVVICAPVDTIVPIYKKLSKIIDKKTIISDVGSVKFNIEKDITSFSGDKKLAQFVGAHPMAGVEKNGIFSACADMFKNANVVITSSIPKSSNNEGVIERMWKDTGANVIKMSAKKHDELAAFTSHLPHILAFSLNRIYNKIRKKNIQVETLTAGSFRSMTRVSVSNADMWSPIFSSNDINISKWLNEFIKELNIFKNNLKNKEKIKKEILNAQKQ